MSNTETKQRIGIKPWIALLFLIAILSGVFKDSDTPLKVLDFANLSGQFGTVYENVNFIGKGGFGAKDGFMAGLNLIPAIMLFSGLLAVFEELGAFKASNILFRPILKPLLGISGNTGVAFVSSFTGSDVAAIMTKDLVDNNKLTDDERTIFTAYQYAGSAVINNTITCGAPLLAICPIGLGPIIIIEFVCKVVGANLVRLILFLKAKKEVK